MGQANASYFLYLTACLPAIAFRVRGKKTLRTGLSCKDFFGDWHASNHKQNSDASLCHKPLCQRGFPRFTSRRSSRPVRANHLPGCLSATDKTHGQSDRPGPCNRHRRYHQYASRPPRVRPKGELLYGNQAGRIPHVKTTRFGADYRAASETRQGGIEKMENRICAKLRC